MKKEKKKLWVPPVQHIMVFRNRIPMTARAEQGKDGRWAGRSEDGMTALGDSLEECADKLSGCFGYVPSRVSVGGE